MIRACGAMLSATARSPPTGTGTYVLAPGPWRGAPRILCPVAHGSVIMAHRYLRVSRRLA
eukprot:620969-Lingulodinium_polyedra.AAC.1